ncbi:uncharacterized protein [Mytilus edulis]|uniref:uncharacterized protein n=1 Tax=Mytilus edulis TaxID=6550 RepID=UPI0039F038F0
MATALCALGLLLVVVSVFSQSLNQHRGPWQVVFKIPAGKRPTGYNSIMDFWKSAVAYNDGNVHAMNDFSSSSEIYKSSILNNWALQSISAVRLSAYKNNQEQGFVVFDAMGKGKNDWLDCGNILDSSWTDITSKTKNFCAFEPNSGNTYKRQVFINEYYNGCSNDVGWIILKDYDATQGCSSWDVTTDTPYCYYSGDSTNINWETGNRQKADSFVVSVLAWDMVFKGAEGVVPTQGSLVNLWTGSDLVNDGNVAAQSLTWAPGLVYKSRVVENWESYPGFFIESVKYAYYTSGLEVAYTVFDARNTDKNGWFDISNILYSCYHDILSYSTMVGSSIVGDGTRSFALHKEWGGCPNDKAWMEILDHPNGGTPCSWDKNVKTRPYFLYSNTGQWALCQANGAWNENQFPSAEVLAVFVKGWKMVMKVAHGQSLGGASGVHDLWTGTYTMNEGDSSALSFNAGTKTLKHSIIDNWGNNYISAVRMSMFKGGLEVAYVVFDANGADKNSWFDKSRIIYSSFNDLSPDSTTNFASINGDAGLNRRFFLQRNYGGCSNDAGWFIVVEGDACSWENLSGSKPYFIYSNAASYEKQVDMDMAEVFAISVDMQDCLPNPCSNGAVCTDEGLTFSCDCTGDWIGDTCSDKNGGLTSWSSWGSCSTTCGAGSKARTRTCTNPAPVGAGSQCSGSTTESSSCNLVTCPINGNWGQWAQWNACSTTCEAGTRSRSRSCNNPAAQYNGLDCQGSSSDSESCTLIANCPIDGVWGSWSSYGACSVTCETGTYTRSRSCNNPAAQYNGQACSGASSHTTSCTLPMCPIDGVWANWGSWGTCSVTCETGTWTRSRTCTNPAPQYSGADCPGSSGSTGSCTLPMCPIDGVWTSWSSWGSCTVTCDGGSQDKTRTCTNPAAQYGGADCVGVGSATQQCNTQACIIDGEWSAWGAWGSCSVSCGGGLYSRTRGCSDPAPSNGGLDCSGDSSDYSSCNSAACPTAAAGVYVQLCPVGWFTCETGGTKCIDASFVCDCEKDCDDESDESTGYSGCDSLVLAACPSSAPSQMMTSPVILLFCLLASVAFLILRKY